MGEGIHYKAEEINVLVKGRLIKRYESTWAIEGYTYKPTNLHTNISRYPHTHIPAYPDTHIPTYLHAYIRTYLQTYLPTYIHTYRQTDIHTYIRTYTRVYIYMYDMYTEKAIFVCMCISIYIYVCVCTSHASCVETAFSLGDVLGLM